MADNPDTKRCPDCRCTNLESESTREHRAPKTGNAEPPVVATTLHIRCRCCRNSWTVLKCVTD